MAESFGEAEKPAVACMSSAMTDVQNFAHPAKRRVLFRDMSSFLASSSGKGRRKRAEERCLPVPRAGKRTLHTLFKGTGGSRCGRGAFPAGLFSLLRREKSPGAAFLGGKTPLLPFLRARLFSEVQKIFKPLTLCLPWKKGCSKKNTSFPAFLRGRKRAEIIIYCFSLQK